MRDTEFLIGRRTTAGLLRTRALVGVVLAGLVGASLLMPLPAGPPARWAMLPVVVGVAVFLPSVRPGRISKALERFGTPIIVALVAALIVATGGALSPYQDLYAIILVVDGAVRSARRLAVDAVVVLGATMWPAVYGPVPNGFFADVVIDFVVWVAIALLIRMIVARLFERDRMATSLLWRLETLGEMADGIVYRVRLDEESTVEYVGPAIEAITGFSQQEYVEDVDLPIRRAHPEDRSSARIPRQPEDGANGRVTYRFQRKDDTWVWLEDHYRFEYDEGRAVAVQGIVFDVSARMELDQAREDALRQQAEAASESAEAIQMQQRFLRGLSHELRTPMTSIIGIAETLYANADALEASVRDDLVARLQRNAVRLGLLLEDLMDVVQVDQAPSSWMDAVDLADLADDVIAELDAGDHVVRSRRGGDTVTRANRGKLRHVVEHLVGNALRHTPPGTHVEVDVAGDDACVVLVVEDDGPGLPAEMEDRWDEPFRQGNDAGASSSPGTGIGLTVVSRFAEVHGGKLRYEAVVGGGTRFTLNLPRAEVAEAASATPAAAPVG